MNVLERRKMFGELSKPGVSRETIEKYIKRLSEEPIKEEYGKLEQLSKQNVEGRKIEAKYRGENRQYWIPQDKCWVSGKGIKLEQAYRIFAEDDKTMKVREVESFSEIDSIVKGLYAEIFLIWKK